MRGKVIIKLQVFLLLLLIAASPARAQNQAEIVEEIIRNSIQSYPGNCPCPYNTDRAGRRCGKRSAYSKPGGRSPLCFETDVTPAMIEEYLRNQRK
jgi:hypothetical protein